MPVRHKLHTPRHSDPDRIGAGLRGLTYDDGQADRRWERREGFPVDVLGQYRLENVLARLMRCSRTLLWLRYDSCSLVGHINHSCNLNLMQILNLQNRTLVLHV